ncbi:AAA family ATPase [Piscinibacter sp. XHJ-5]|uniref:ATP-binding protein n=1 Tax=Piscinibacter sp. XHJ-5 TaxID=3037797 RepID=UPI002452BCC8|nr:AAA family ATPase [Piscinibacter sp. XHJ-5]
MNVSDWLRELGLERYVDAFIDNDVDETTLPRLTEADLAEIGVTSVGHRRRLSAAIAALVREPPVASASSASAQGTGAERRQLSVLYCQMVTPETVSDDEGLDPEPQRAVIQQFHEACTRMVAEYDGHVANFYVDCMLAYFGWPRAHEDDAERAVSAGLTLVRRVKALRTMTGRAVQARVGIATGSVVVGDLIHEGPARDQSAVGLAPNLGARVLGLAEPGQVVIDELTRRLLGSSFALRPLGQHALKGISDAVAAYAVIDKRTAHSRFDARRGHELTPMIGRDHELALLTGRWVQAQSGEGVALLLSGDAGIGKSRLARALLDVCAQQPHWAVTWQCSPYHTGSMLWPVIQRLGTLAGLAGEDSNEAALDKLEAVAGEGETAALYAALLGLNGTQRYGPLEMTPQVVRERTLEVLVEQLFELAAEQPLLLIVEDAHWIDPTTEELIGRCLDNIDRARILMLMTSRPNHRPGLAVHPSVTRLSLSRLSRANVEALVARLGGEALQAVTRSTIVTQSDGVPLFVEELTRAVLETGEAAIPASLHGSLLARLDAIPEVKEVAQVAACIGREFDRSMLMAVADRRDAVDAAIVKLVTAELVFRQGDPAHPRYVFKHALVQEAAYDSLLRSRQQTIHTRILELLEARRDTPPEMLAHHAQGARQADKAVGYWRKAGEAALAKSAYGEAAGYLSHAIQLTQAREDGVDRRGQELVLQLQLGQAYRGSRGYGASDTRQAFERAYELFDVGTDDASHRFRAQYGLWAGHINRAEIRDALRLAVRSLADAQDDGEPQVLLCAHRIVATSHVLLGEFTTACRHFDQMKGLLGALDPAEAAESDLQFGFDPAAGRLAWLAWVRQIQGLAKQSHALSEQARRIVSSLRQIDVRAFMHFLFALRATFVRDIALVCLDVEALAQLANRHRLRLYRGYVSCLRGWIALASGRPPDEAVSDYEAGLEELTAMGARLYVPFFMAGLASALAGAGRHDEALETVDRAIEQCDKAALGWCEAELSRLRGEVILRDPHGQPTQAVNSFQHALTLARPRGAKLWELRSAISLARVWADGGQHERAMNLLSPVYAWFDDDVDTVDLIEARELMSKLKQGA